MTHATPKLAEGVHGGSDTGLDADPFRIVGTVVDGRYLVERVVGSGGFAIVYRARHLRFDSLVALKVLHRSLRHGRGRQEEFAQRLLAEGKFLFDLAPLHWSFVRVFEMGSITTNDGVVAPYLALEWLEGATLNDEVRRLRRAGRQLELGQVLSLFDGVASGLAVAHARRIAHRDIKPANIYLGLHEGKVRPRILDFGLAKAMSQSELSMDVFGDSHFSPTPFTPAYGAPEQWQRRLGATGAWTDVHALALLCVELLAGKPPLRGSDTAQLMASCLDEKFRPTPRALGVELPAAVEAVFEKALSIDPRERHRDARVFWQALCQAAKVRDPERQLRPLTLPLLGDTSNPSSPAEAHDNQPSLASLTAKSTAMPSQLAGSGEHWGVTGERVPMHSMVSPLQRRIFLVAALLLSGLLLPLLVPVRSARGPLQSAPAPSERPALEGALPSPALLTKSLVSSSTVVPPLSAEKPARTPAPRASANTVRKPNAQPSPPPKLPPQIGSAQVAATPAVSSVRPAQPEGSSSKGFEVTPGERAGTQLDRMMFEDSLTRRK
jgi:serine/threonine-protein kinase